MIAFDLYAQDFRPFRAIDGQHAVRRNLLDVFGVVEVIAEGLGAALFQLAFFGFLLGLLLRLGPLAVADAARGRSERGSRFGWRRSRR